MKILHLSTFDQVGGAARAAYRIHQSLKNAGVESQMLVQYKKGSDPAVSSVEDQIRSRLRASLDTLPLKLYPHRQQGFSIQWFPSSVNKKVNQINPDIINLNWICNGYLNIETFAKFNKPLVWTLHDMWPFTGGCHYGYGCDRYQKSCGNCPQLQSDKSWDLSSWSWQRKASAWKDLNLTIVATSSWMAKCASSSSLFKGLRVDIIPLGLDTSIFKPIEPQLAREQLNLPQDKQLILFGGSNATGEIRKGFHLLQTALKSISQTEWRNRLELVIFGSDRPETPVDMGFTSHYLGSIQDDLLLKLVYSAADVMIAPSIEEAFGQTASESLACGTPVVVFKNTGLADIVDHHQNGYVANYCDTEDLAKGIIWVLEERQRNQKLRIQAREKAEREFQVELQVNRYLSLFREILTNER